jgi:hypothetical protein
MKLSLNTLSPLLIQRIYRLALTATGNHTVASATTIQLFRNPDFPSHDQETAALIRLFEQLKQMDKDPWKVRKPAQPDKQASRALDAQLKVLGRAGPQARCMLALFSLWGMPAAEIGQLLGQSVEALHKLRIDLALARGLIATENEGPELERLARFIANDLSEAEQIAQRAELLNSAHARGLRNGLVVNDEQLGPLLASLFSTTTPDDLIAKINHQEQAPPRRRLAKKSLLFNLSVIAIVASMIGLLLIWPQTQSEAKSGRSVSSEPARDLEDLIEAALRRFEEPTLDQGLLHERYTITIDEQSWQLERWYDFGQRQRFAMSVHGGQRNESFYSVKGDGINGLEISSYQGRVGVELSPELLAQISPILMQQPNPDITQFSQTPALEQFFLKQALENQAYSLGTSRFLSRPVTIIAYPSRYFLPDRVVHPDWDYDHAQILLTLDNQTFSLLQAQVLLDGQAGSTIITPWRAEHFSFDDQADPELFAITGERNDELLSPRIPFNDYSQLPKSFSLRNVLELSEQPIYLPRTLIEQSLWARMLYQEEAEGALFSLLIEDGQRLSVLTTLPQAWSQPKPDDEIKQIGSFSYTTTVREAVTQVSLLDQSTGQHFGLVLIDYLTPRSDMESKVEALIRSLEPLTLENIDYFQTKFIEP